MRFIVFAALLITACTKPTQEAENAVRRMMKDPDATQFRDVQFCGTPAKSTVRGEYNGKNSYGAYQGFRPFYYASGVAEIQENGAGPLFQRCLTEMRQETRRIEAHTARITANSQ